MNRSKLRGVTFIELMVVVAVIGLLAAIALPSYRSYIIRAARVEAQAELLELASLQEKIFLNSTAYTANVATAYNGQAAGGLGRTSGQTKDGRYGLSLTQPGGAQTFVLTATPVPGLTQATDGNISIDETGRRLWGAASW